MLAYAHGPGRVKMGHDAAVQFKGRVGGIVCCAAIGITLFIDPFWDVGSTQAGHRFDRAKKVVQHIAPVAEHVANNAPIILLAIVPGGTLSLSGMTFKHPIPELPAYRENPAKEAVLDQALQLDQTGQPQLVLHHPALDPGLPA